MNLETTRLVLLDAVHRVLHNHGVRMQRLALGMELSGPSDICCTGNALTPPYQRVEACLLPPTLYLQCPPKAALACQ